MKRPLWAASFLTPSEGVTYLSDRSLSCLVQRNFPPQDSIQSILIFNRSAEIIYSTNSAQMLLLEIRRLTLPDTLTGNTIHSFGADLFQALQFQTSRHGTIRIFTPSGSREFRYTISGTLCPLSTNSFATVVLTEVKKEDRIAAQLRNTQSQALYFFDSHPHPMCLCFQYTGSVFRVNNQLRDIFKLSPENLGEKIFCWQTFQRFKTTFPNPNYWRSIPFVFNSAFTDPIRGLFSVSSFFLDGLEYFLFHFHATSLLPSDCWIPEDIIDGVERQYSQLLAGLGHEVGNVLTILSGNLQILSQQDVFKDHQEEYRSMSSELDRSIELASDFRLLSKRPSRRKVSYLQEIVSEIRNILQQHASLHQVVLDFQFEDTPPVLVDENDIRQAIINLFKNAYESMENGGKIVIGVQAASAEVRLTVKDEGSGIPADIAKQIGTPYITSKEGGTGLGLAICYEKVHANSGRIEWESDHTGTRFFLFFPAHIETNPTNYCPRSELDEQS